MLRISVLWFAEGFAFSRWLPVIRLEVTAYVSLHHAQFKDLGTAYA